MQWPSEEGESGGIHPGRRC